MAKGVGLPDCDGFTLARRIRTGGYGDELKLIALTGYGELSDQHRALEAGFDVHLTKPVSLEDLQHHIELVLQIR